MTQSVKEMIGLEAYDMVRQRLTQTFPEGSLITDADVDGAILVAWNDPHAAHEAYGIPPKPEPSIFRELHDKWIELTLARKPETLAHPLYLAKANHHRTRSYDSTVNFESRFVGEAPMARVVLPATLPEGQAHIISTSIGDVDLIRDHIAGAVDKIVFGYGAKIGFTPARVELITTVRHLGTRMATSVGIYLIYKQAEDKAPVCYILESGMASGESKVLYFGKDWETPIKVPSNYNVTPFSSPDNVYEGRLFMSKDDPNEPAHLTINVFTPGHTEPHFALSVDYERQLNITPIAGAKLFLEAGMRMTLIGNALGVQTFALPGIALNAAAEIASEHYKWEVKPQLVKI